MTATDRFKVSKMNTRFGGLLLYKIANLVLSDLISLPEGSLMTHLIKA